jgi:hypothetical protein
LDELLTLGAPAGEIIELREVAQALHLEHVMVFRSTEAAHFAGVFAPSDAACLGETQTVLFVIREPDELLGPEVLEAADQFVWNVALLRCVGEPRWKQLAFYLGALRECRRKFNGPPWLKHSDAHLILVQDPWWGFHDPAGLRQATAFGTYLVDHCARFSDLHGALTDAELWIEAEGAGHGGFDQMFQAFRATQRAHRWSKMDK